MSFLADKIRAASQKYYSGEEPIMSDAEFDGNLEKLKLEEPDNPLITAVGHGYDVMLDSTPGKKFNHLYNDANGLDKAYTWSEIIQKFKTERYYCGLSLKLDGLSIFLYYVDGKLDKALTRGKDNIGIDITDKALKIQPSIITTGDNITGAFRGEIVMTHQNFMKFKEIHPDAKNARNSAAGLINSGNICPELKLLNIYIYTIFGVSSSEIEMIKYIDVHSYEGMNYITYRDSMMYIKKVFRNVAPFTFEVITETNYLDIFQILYHDWSRFDIPADGVVITDNIIELIQSDRPLPYDIPDEFVPYTTKYKSIGFKFKSDTADTRVTSIDWNMSKQRRCVPIVNVEPVELAGTSVRKCTGHNAKYIKDNLIGPGALVEIEKHGEIIPNINKILEIGPQYSIPQVCPNCNEPLVWKGVDLICENTRCDNALLQDALVWCKTLAPIDGLSDKLITKFIDNYACDFSIPSIMAISFTYIPPINTQLGKFCKMIKDLTTNTFTCDVALRALNIPRLGEETSKKLGKHRDAVLDILNTSDESAVYCIARRHLGQADSESLAKNINKFHRLSLIIDRVIDMESSENSHFDIMKVAVTGKLSVPRKQFESELKSVGFVLGDITKQTHYLITDNPDSSSSKNKLANKLGIPKLTEEEFRSKFM